MKVARRGSRNKKCDGLVGGGGGGRGEVGGTIDYLLRYFFNLNLLPSILSNTLSWTNTLGIAYCINRSKEPFLRLFIYVGS